MKHILFIKGEIDDQGFKNLEFELSNSRLEYTISRISNSVTVEGNTDAVYTAKSILNQSGFELL